jgi:sugar phosphate isomerase/epimerase
MNTSRRTFIRKGTLAATGVLILPNLFSTASAKAKGIVGIQLYCIRDEMKKDPLGSLKQVASMGYQYVEHASYVNGKFYGYPPAEFRKILDDLGLKMLSGHTSFSPEHWDKLKNDFTDKWKKTVEDATVLGQKYVVSPSMGESMYSTYDSLMKTLDLFNKIGDLCHKNGMKFGYHNHDFEFSKDYDGKKMFDVIMNTIDPGKVVIQLDTGNLYNGGAVALDVVNKYPGRFENIHVKDEIRSQGGGDKYESCILGEGIVSIKQVLDIATKTGGAEVYIIEQESYQGKAPMDCIKKDLEIMKMWGYA